MSDERRNDEADTPGSGQSPPPPPEADGGEASSPPPGPEASAPVSDAERDARTWAMLAHLGGVFLFLGPLLVWATKKDTHPFVAEQSREALNFQITMTLFALVAFVINFIPLVNCLFGLVSLAVFLADVVLIILAAVKARDGEHYRYPFSLRFVP